MLCQQLLVTWSELLWKEEKKSAKLSVSVFYWSQLDRGSREITFMLGMQHFPVLSPLQHVRLSL